MAGVPAWKTAYAPLQQSGRHCRLCRGRIKMRQAFSTIQKFISVFRFSIIKTWTVGREPMSTVQKLSGFSGLYLYQVHVFLHASELPFLFALIQGPFTVPFVLCSCSCSITCKSWNSHSLLIWSPFSLVFSFFSFFATCPSSSC